MPREELDRLVSEGKTFHTSTRLHGRRRYFMSELAIKELHDSGYFETQRAQRQKARAVVAPGDDEGADDEGAQGGPEPWESRTFDKWAAKEKYWKAALAELEFKKANRDLVTLGQVQSSVSGILEATRKNFLALPTKAKQQANLTEKQAILLTELVHQMLADLDRGLQGVLDE